MSITDGSVEYAIKTNASLTDISDSSDNLMNVLGFRQKNKTYNVFDVVYHHDLPTGHYLYCIKVGTTSNSNLTLTSTTLNTKINDGTVIWMIKTILSTDFLTNGENSIPANSDLNDYIYAGSYICYSGTIAKTLLNCPHKHSNFRLNVVRTTGKFNDETEWWGYQVIIAPMGDASVCFFRSHEGTTDTWENWKEIMNTPIYIDENTHIDDLNLQMTYYWQTSIPQGLPDKERYNLSEDNVRYGTLKVEGMGIGTNRLFNPLKQTIDFNVAGGLKFIRYKTGSPLKWSKWRIDFTNQSSRNSLSYSSNIYKINIATPSRSQTLLILTEYDLYIVKLSSTSNTDVTAEVKCLGGFSSTPITCTARVTDIIQESLPNRSAVWNGILELTFSKTMNGIKILGNIEV